MSAQPTSKMNLLEMTANLYRKTFKRIRIFHLGVHWASQKLFFPILETIIGFKTMSDDPFWFRFELLTGRHEPETTARIKQILKPGMTVLDIGAHVGYYSRIATTMVGASGRVVAFEPHPRNHETLQKNVGSRGNITLLQVALADQEGTAELHDYLMMSASGSLHYDEKLREVQLSNKRSETDFAPRLGDFEPRVYKVRTAPVDTLLAEIGVSKVDMVKMDIEGAEMGALRGMKQTIQNSPKLSLVMEYNPMGLKAFDNDPVSALQEVLALGFSRMYVIEPDNTLTDYTADRQGIETLTERLMHNMGVVNLLFTRG